MSKANSPFQILFSIEKLVMLSFTERALSHVIFTSFYYFELCVYIYVYVRVGVCVCNCPQNPEQGFVSLEAGDTSSCEPLCMAAGTQT